VKPTDVELYIEKLIITDTVPETWNRFMQAEFI